MHTTDPTNSDFNRVKIFTFNPKSVSLNDLFGYINPLTNEWNNGILAQKIIKETEHPGKYNRWFLLDGPGDVSWMENLNTVLDDTKILCLTNG
jgi:dynein heavy chain